MDAIQKWASVKSAQSLENGFLWQNLVNACNQNFATTLKAYVEKLTPEMHAQVQEKIAQHTAAFQGRLAESTAHLKTWFAKELISFDKSVYTKLQKIEANQGEIRALVASAWEGQRVSDKKMENMRKEMQICLMGLQSVQQKLEFEENSQVLADVLWEMRGPANFSKEASRRLPTG